LKKDYTVRSHQPGEEEEIAQILQIAFNGWPHIDLSCTPLEHWRWKYLENPLDANLITVCSSGGRLIGVMHSIPQKIKLKNDTYLIIYSCDTCVHPEYRGMGVYTNMYKFSDKEKEKQGFKSNYWVSSNPIVIKASSVHEHKFSHSITNLARIRDIEKQTEAMPIKNTLLMKKGYQAIELLNKIKNFFIKTPKKISDIKISEINNFDYRINEFWNEVSDQYDYIIVRDMEYLNWRYCDPRGGDFIIHLAEDNDIILGFSVLIINRYRADYPVGFIVDLLALKDRLDVADSLLSNAINYFDINNINIINYQIVKNHPYETIFKKHGFVDSRIRTSIFNDVDSAEELKEKYENLKKSPANRIYYSYGDIDSLPVDIPQYR